MTPNERDNPKIIGGSRKKRIANGSGTDISMVNKLLKQHKSQLDLNSLLAYIRADNQVQEDDQTILSLEVL